MKTCSHCSTEKPLAQFPKGTCKDGLHSYCKDCMREAARLSYHRRKNDPSKIASRSARAEKQRQWSRQSYLRHRTECLAAHKEWRHSNPEKMRAYALDWKRRNPERVKEIEAGVRSRLAPERVREYARVRNARKKSAFVASVHERAIFERDGWACQICYQGVDPDATQLREKATIDHIIPLSLGGTHEPSNVQLAHFKCNAAKGNRITMNPVRA